MSSRERALRAHMQRAGGIAAVVYDKSTSTGSCSISENMTAPEYPSSGRANSPDFADSRRSTAYGNIGLTNLVT